MAYSDNDGVYGLLTNLCSRTASKYYTHSRISQKILYTKMRSHAYEIILKKSTKEYPTKKLNPMIGLLSQLFIYQQSTRNITEYKRVAELSKVIQELKSTDFGDCEDDVHNVLRFLISLSDCTQEDQSTVMYHKPFSFGLLDEMLPKPCRQPFSSTQPYAYYPSHVFQLPFSLKHQGSNLDSQKSQNCTEYTVESFDSGSLLLDSTQRSHKRKDSDLKTFLSPMSLASMTSTHMSPYSENNIFNLPRLRTPRDLTIPSSEHADVKISLASNSTKDDLKEMFRAQVNDETVDVWELASQIDKHIPDSIWDIVSKLPPITERQLIASSKREIGLWHQTYCGMMSDLDIITEKQFIRHIMYLIIGIETTSFPFSEESNCFYMKHNLVLEGISKEHIKRYVSDLILVGTYYRRLYKFAFNQTLGDHFHSKGLVYEVGKVYK